MDGPAMVLTTVLGVACGEPGDSLEMSVDRPVDNRVDQWISLWVTTLDWG